MSDLDDMLEGALQSFETLSGETFSWKGSDYTCIIADKVESEDYDEGGRRALLSGLLEATRTQFGATLPKYRDKVVIDGARYSIRETVTDSTTIRIRFGKVSE